MDIPILKNLHLTLGLRGAVNVGLCRILFDWSGGLAAVRHLHHGRLNLGSLLWAKTDRQTVLMGEILFFIRTQLFRFVE